MHPIARDFSVERFLKWERIHTSPTIAGEGHVFREWWLAVVVERVSCLDEERGLELEHGAVDFMAVFSIVPEFELLAGGNGEG